MAANEDIFLAFHETLHSSDPVIQMRDLVDRIRIFDVVRT